MDDETTEPDDDSNTSDSSTSKKPARKRGRSVRQRGFRRKRSVSRKSLTRDMLAAEWLRLGPEARNFPRPRTRDECRDMPRPCPYAGCKHHNYLDVNPKTGSITLNWPDHEPDTMPGPTCSLDVAAAGAHTHEQVGEVLNITRERIRQIEIRALIVKLKPAAKERHLDEVELGGPDTRSALEEIADNSNEVALSDITYITI